VAAREVDAVELFAAIRRFDANDRLAAIAGFRHHRLGGTLSSHETRYDEEKCKRAS
jgi:hypothetical protein